MAGDNSPKPAIPAWQLSPKPNSDPESQSSETSLELHQEGQEPVEAEKDESEQDQKTLPEGFKEIKVEQQDGDSVSDDTAEPTPEQLIDQMRAFLADEAIKTAPAEKVRAFFESKNIPINLIDQVIPPLNESAQTTLNPSDFALFKKEETQMRRKIVNVPTSKSQTDPTAPPPPIITYPEFLVEAHKPAPLITFNRLINIFYVAGSLATLTYAANQFLLKPMTTSLTESRHDFASHSQGKLDEFNDKLSKIVSRVPEAATYKLADSTVADDVESVNSDPTELFHRDMGTQTSPSPSPSASADGFSFSNQEKRSTIEEQEARLQTLRSLLDGLATATEKKANENQRKESIDELRHYLDTMMYSSPGINLWAQTDFNSLKKTNGGAQEAKRDMIDQVKAEIRSVKGSLLSAKRFPSAVSSGGSMYSGRVGAS